MIIKEYKIGEHCFGPILEVNGKDYEDLDKKEVRKFINHMMENDINSELLMREIFSTCLEYRIIYLGHHKLAHTDDHF